MLQNQLSFESENLVVDWIGFNIQGLIDPKPIANYLFHFGFNSTLCFGSNRKQKTLCFNSKNRYQVYITVYKYSEIYWDGIKIDFSGSNASQFYKLIKKKIDWNIFQLAKLNISRFDLYYFREIQLIDQKDQLKKFFSNLMSELANRYKKNNFSLDRSTRDYILRIGNRKSSNFYRIYQTKKGLRYELEMKKNQIKKFSNLLFCYDIKQFEERLTKHFYMYSKKVLTFNHCYTDWLIRYFRKNHTPIKVNSLLTTYLKKQTDESFENVKIFTLLQFIAFTRSKKCTEVERYDQKYCLIQFTLKEYMEFSGVKTINQYQRNKFIKLFYSFQKTDPLISNFDDAHFQSILAFPYIDIQKQTNSWVVKLAISKLLYNYPYPFAFPNTFLTYKNVYDLQIKLKLVEAIATVPLEKVFYVEVFLQRFNLSTSKKTTIKKILLKYLVSYKWPEL